VSELPDAIAWFIRQLTAHGFEQVSDETSESFGDRVMSIAVPPWSFG
jgi:hypothetical protein